jgi:hypothetical protein
VDPVRGAARAAEALRPDGRLALFWNVAQPPAEVAEAFAAVYRQVLPGTVFARGVGGGLDSYSAFFTKATDGLRETGGFGQPEQWRFDWERPYTRDEWLEQVPTSGGHSRLEAGTLQDLLRGIGHAIDEVGGSFHMTYATVVVTAARVDQRRDPAQC